mgnify:CR=1 FL=1
MIYDKPITVLAMPDTQGIPTKGSLVKKFDSWCAEKTVYASRFWESVANGSRVDKLAAAVILEQWLASQSGAAERGMNHGE